MTSAGVPAKRAKPRPIVRPPCRLAPYHDLRWRRRRDTPERSPNTVPRREPHMTDKLLMQKDGAIGWIIFNHPENRNAVSQEMGGAMPGYVKKLTSDQPTPASILRGAGDAAVWPGAD